MPAVLSRMHPSHGACEFKWSEEQLFAELSSQHQESIARHRSKQILKTVPDVTKLMSDLVASTKGRRIEKKQLRRDFRKTMIETLWSVQKQSMLDYDSTFESYAARQEMDRHWQRRRVLQHFGVSASVMDALFSQDLSTTVFETLEDMGLATGSAGGARFVLNCSCCDSPLTKNLRCACGMVCYCSHACQKVHWREGHRYKCSFTKSNPQDSQ